MIEKENLVLLQDKKLLWDMTNKNNIGGQRLQNYILCIIRQEKEITQYAISSSKNMSPVIFLLEEAGHNLNIKDFFGKNLLQIYLESYFSAEKKPPFDVFMDFVSILSKYNSWHEKNFYNHKENNCISYLIKNLFFFKQDEIFKILDFLKNFDFKPDNYLNSKKDNMFHVIIDGYKNIEHILVEKKEKIFFELMTYLSIEGNICQKNINNIDPLKEVIYILDEILDKNMQEDKEEFIDLVFKMIPEEKKMYYYGLFFKNTDNLLNKKSIIFNMINNGWPINNILFNGQTILGISVLNYLKHINEEDNYKLIEKIVNLGGDINQKNAFSMSIFDIKNMYPQFAKKIDEKFSQISFVQKEKNMMMSIINNKKEYNKKTL